MAEETIGNYRLLNCMFTGQVSQVWEVVETSSHRHFAMKLLLPEKANDGEVRRQLYHDADVGKKMAHPNIIKIVHVSHEAKVAPHFVMEFGMLRGIKLRAERLG